MLADSLMSSFGQPRPTAAPLSPPRPPVKVAQADRGSRGPSGPLPASVSTIKVSPSAPPPHLVIPVEAPPELNSLFDGLGSGGITLSTGVFLYRNSREPDDAVLGHEDRHFIQAILMGPAYYPSYVIFAGFGSIVGRFTGKEQACYNPMEMQAGLHAGGYDKC